MKINLKAFAILAMVLSVVVVSGCAQPAGNQTTAATPTPAKIESAEEASKTVVDTSKDVKQISDTLTGIDKTLSGK